MINKENILNEYEPSTEELDKLVVTYVMLNNNKIMISQYHCSDFYKSYFSEDMFVVTLLDYDNKIVGDILDVDIIKEVNNNRVELYINL